jgi:hypothetical protein
MLVRAALPSHSVRVNISMDLGLLSAIDQAAKARDTTRSGLLSEAARQYLKPYAVFFRPGVSVLTFPPDKRIIAPRPGASRRAASDGGRRWRPIQTSFRRS